MGEMQAENQDYSLTMDEGMDGGRDGGICKYALLPSIRN